VTKNVGGGLLLVGGALGIVGALVAYATRRWLAEKGTEPSPSQAQPQPSRLQTGYFHLERLDVREGQRVRRGEVIGLMGADPKGGPRHLHFEVAPYPFPGGKYKRAITLNPRQFLESGYFAWPVERWKGHRDPVLSSEHRDENPDRETHAGVDIMFRRIEGLDNQPVRPGEGAPRFVAYRGTQILAAADGVVVQADWIETGFRVWIAH
jgi:murein DD-endopeptidase MepM/ murein hydrolase activator NlpD